MLGRTHSRMPNGMVVTKFTTDPLGFHPPGIADVRTKTSKRVCGVSLALVLVSALQKATCHRRLQLASPPQVPRPRHTMKLCRSSVFTLLCLLGSTSAMNMTAVQIFDDDSCTGTPLQVVFTPTVDCGRVTPATNCSLEAQELALYASGACTNDPRTFAAAAFGDAPYALVELHRPDTNCDELEGVAAYRIDSGCHATIDEGTSFQVEWSDAIAPMFKLFADASCSSSPMFEIALTVDSDECYGGSMKLFVGASDESASTE